jgi:DNA polymerase-3 subunit delta
MQYEPFEGADDNVISALRSINTYAFQPGRKVVSLLNSRIFYSKQDAGKFLEKAKAAYTGGETGAAVSAVLALLGMLNLTLDDVSDKGTRSQLGFEKSGIADGVWFDALIEHCRAADRRPGGGGDVSVVLTEAVENGFPDGHCLIITADTVDKRRRLFKIIAEKGVVIDCAVPKGDRKAERAEQNEVLRSRLRSVLKASRKSMGPSAYALMVEKTGFDLRTFSDGLAKLVDYVGQRDEITVQDVETLLTRTKSDPVYSFTNALTDGDADGAFFFLHSLLDGGFHPLQILTALANHLRKLLVIREVIDDAAKGAYRHSMPFNLFRSQVMPLIKTYDESLAAKILAWNTNLKKKQGVSRSKKKKKAQRPSTDLIVAPNPQNAYPVYMLFQKADRFSGKALFKAFEKVSETDLMLKGSGQPAEVILDRLVVEILTA